MIIIITLLCISIWMLHMFFKLGMYKTGSILSTDVRNHPGIFSSNIKLVSNSYYPTYFSSFCTSHNF